MATAWATIRLGDVAEFRNGLNFNKTQRGPGLRVVGVPDFQDRVVADLENLEEVDSSLLRDGRVLLHEGDILFVRSNGNRDLIGRSLYITSEPQELTSHSGFTIRLRFTDARCFPRFYAYFFRARNIRQLLSAHGGGTNINNLNQGILSSLNVPLPALDVQKRIASILSAYDDLIKNNTRRIAILEEMARRVFEHFTTETKLDVELVPLAQAVSFSIGGDWGGEEPTPECPAEVRVVRGTDFSECNAGEKLRCPRRYISEKSFSRRALQEYDLVVENSINAKTRSAGSTLLVWPGLLHRLGSRVIAASFCRVFRFHHPEFAVFAHLHMSSLRASGRMTNFQVVAANGIANFQSQRFLETERVPVPKDPQVRKKLEKFLSDLLSSTLADQTYLLTESRDLLLPKLISGEIDVGAVEAPKETEAA